MWGPGPVCLVELADGFGHPQDFMFCGLPHEEEGQGITGEVEEALPAPGCVDAGIRDEGRGREVRREDGAEPVYVPQELACLRCIPLAASRVVRPLIAHPAA